MRWFQTDPVLGIELCHPPKYLDKVKTITKGLREGPGDKHEMWSVWVKEVSRLYITQQCMMKMEDQGVLVRSISIHRDWHDYRGLEKTYEQEFMKEFANNIDYAI